MKYGIMGAAIPLLVKGPTFEYLDEVAPGISPKDVKRRYKAIVARQPEIGGTKNNLIMGCIWQPTSWRSGRWPRRGWMTRRLRAS